MTRLAARNTISLLHITDTHLFGSPEGTLLVEKYGEKNCLVREKGSHSYDNFEGELPAVFEFLLSSIGQSVR